MKNININIALLGLVIIIVISIGIMAIKETRRQVDDFCNRTNWTGYATGDMMINCSRCDTQKDMVINCSKFRSTNYK